jgi:hypothetical protein
MKATMFKTAITPKFYLILSIIMIGAFLRLLPHWPNFTPIAAIALFGGTMLKRKDVAFIIPVAVMLISDLIIGFHKVMIPVYLSFMIIVSLGFFLRTRIKPASVAALSLTGSTIFFIITNFASWATGMMPYSQDFTGLIQAYIAGLPFFLNGIMGDLFFNGVFFGSYYLISQKVNIFAR